MNKTNKIVLVAFALMLLVVGCINATAQIGYNGKEVVAPDSITVSKIYTPDADRMGLGAKVDPGTMVQVTLTDKYVKLNMECYKPITCGQVGVYGCYERICE